MSFIKRTPELKAQIKAAEKAGDYALAGYLMAPGLQEHTGDTLPQMLEVVTAMDALGYPKPEYALYNEGVVRWVKEQIDQQNAVKP